MPPKTESYRDLLAARLQDPAFREAYEALEPAFQIARLRIAQGLTQAELAARMGTREYTWPASRAGHRTLPSRRCAAPPRRSARG